MKYIILNILILLFGIGCTGASLAMPKTEDNTTSKVKETVTSKTEDNTTSKVKETVTSKTEDNTTSKVKETVTSKTEDNTTSKVKETVTSKTEDNTTSKVKETVISKAKDNAEDTLTPEENIQKLSKDIEKLLFSKKQDINEAYRKLEEISSFCKEQLEDKIKHICAISYKNKGKIEERQNEYIKAIKSYKNAIEFKIKDKNGNLTEKIADIYYVNLENTPEAINKLEELKHNPNRINDSKLYYYIGALYIEQGNIKERKKNYGKAKINILNAKKLGNRDAEYLWFKYDLYKY